MIGGAMNTDQIRDFLRDPVLYLEKTIQEMVLFHQQRSPTEIKFRLSLQYTDLLEEKAERLLPELQRRLTPYRIEVSLKDYGHGPQFRVFWQN